jgi:hypothetical protein
MERLTGDGMNKKIKSLSAFIFFIISPLIFLVMFQNCGKKFESELSLINSSSQSSGSAHLDTIGPEQLKK